MFLSLSIMSNITKNIKYFKSQSFDHGGFGQVHEAYFFPEGTGNSGYKVSFVALLHSLIRLKEISPGRRQTTDIKDRWNRRLQWDGTR